MPNQQFADNRPHNKSTPSRLFRIEHGLLVFCLIIILSGLYLTFKSTSSTAGAAARSGGYHGISLRVIHHHKARAICSVSRPNQARCMAEVSLGLSGKPLNGTPASSGSFGPIQFHTAYNLPCTPGGPVASICSAPSSFGPQTIAIVDAGNFSSGTAGLASSLSDYDSYYGLPACTLGNGCLDVVNQSGTTSPLPADAGWSDEIALDVETAQMMCQTCKILLVEANSNAVTDLAAANAMAATFDPLSISNSWGANGDTPSLDSDFEHSGIADVAATGDSGSTTNGAEWPADNPDIVAVAGTTLQLQTDNDWASETLWSDSGGGCSDYYAAAAWQSSLSNWNGAGCGSYRSFADVSADADPDTGAAINISGSWYEFGGTSLATPIIASIFALSGGVPSGTIGSSVPYTNNTSSNFHDITSGNDCTTGGELHCTAGVGFDTPSGLGSPDGLGGFTSLPTQPSALSATTIDQNHIDLSWTASTASAGIAGYNVYRGGTEIGTVSTTSYDDSGLTPNDTYLYYVVAYDNSGNHSLPSSTVSATSSYPADINQDGHINLLDLSILASKYGATGSNIGRADINRDDAVNLLDLSILAQQYGSE